MAASKKRAVPGDVEDVESNEGEAIDNDQQNEEDNNEDEEMEGQEFINQVINVEFEARNMEDGDFHGIKKLLSQLYLKANIDISQLTDTLISQNYVGSVIKQVEFDEDDSDEMDIDDADDVHQVFGVISVVNITERKDLKCIKELKSTLLDRCSKCAKKADLAAILNDDSKSVGMIINERFINIPAQIAVPSFASLWKEAEKACEKKMKYNFTHYLMVSKMCSMTMTGSQGDQDLRSYINQEEQFFYDEALLSCEYSVKEERNLMVSGTWDADDDEMEPFRVVMVIPADKISTIMTKLNDAFG